MANLKEIANMANVSLGTVNRVIYKRVRVSQITAQRVQQIIRDVQCKSNSITLIPSHLPYILLDPYIPNSKFPSYNDNDLIEQNISCLQEGVIDFLIGQRAEMQNYTGIYKQYKRIVIKEKSEAKVLLPFDIIAQENLRYYQN